MNPIAVALVTISGTGYLYLTGLFGVFQQIYAPVFILSSLYLLMNAKRILSLGPALLPVLFFSISLVPGLLLAGSDAYSQSKLVGLGIAVILILLPRSLPYPDRGAVATISVTAFACFAITLYLLFFGTATSNGQITLDSLNTIHAARAVGYVTFFTGALLLLPRSLVKAPRSFLLSAFLLSAWTLNMVGSRGPMLSAAAALSVVAIILLGHRRFNFWALTALSSALAAAVVFLDVLESSRLVNTESNGREAIYEYAFKFLRTNPLGVGWGNYQTVEGAGIYQWPHNIFLEIGIEGGWLALIGFTLLLAFTASVAIRAAINRPNLSVAPVIAVGFLVYALINAQFSADIVGNGILWTAIGIALSVGWTSKKSQAV